jgi:plastocyanin
MRRRTLLAAVGTAVATGLAGCGGGSPDGSGGTDAPEPTAATDTQTPADTATATPTDTATTAEQPFETPGGTDTATATATNDVAQTVTAGPEFELRFAPEEFEITAGGTVRWVWESSGHNVIAASTPAGSDWPGTPGGTSRTFDEGYTYEYTFETTGTYEYYCNPHRDNGMTGSLTVVEG